MRVADWPKLGGMVSVDDMGCLLGESMMQHRVLELYRNIYLQICNHRPGEMLAFLLNGQSERVRDVSRNGIHERLRLTWGMSACTTRAQCSPASYGAVSRRRGMLGEHSVDGLGSVAVQPIPFMGN